MKEQELPEEAGAEIVFGNRTVGWYKWAAWFSKQVCDSQTMRHLKTPQQAFAILCKGDELSLPPFAAWTYIYQTQAGRLAIQSKGALAVVQSKASFEGYREWIEDEGVPTMRAVAEARRKGHDPVIKEFSLADAEKAGLLRERRTREGERYDSTYQSYLKDMLLARARARALDIAFAAELGGIQIEGTAEDADAAEARRNPKAVASGQEMAQLPSGSSARPRVQDPILTRLGLRPAATAALPAGEPVVGEGEEEELVVVGEVVEEQPPAAPTPQQSGPPPAAQPTAGKPATAFKSAGDGGTREGGGKPHPPKRAPATKPQQQPPPTVCPRCEGGIQLNAMGGCDACGWPTSNFSERG